MRMSEMFSVYIFKSFMISSRKSGVLKGFWKRCKSTSTTIFALSSGLDVGGNAIAVVRVSGQDTKQAIKSLAHREHRKVLSKPRQAILSSLYDPETKELIDKGITVYFPSPNSYTGEDLCEFHVHGSRAVVSMLLQCLGSLDGCRPAEPGEFTKRAYVNGKVNLAEAEGISDLISAQTNTQRKRALDAVSGRLTEIYDKWRTALLEGIAYLEANIDFGEDELLDEETLASVISNLSKLRSEINGTLTNSARKSERIKHGVEIAIIGKANAGKSSLINKLCEREVSIVSPISGTTRDVVEAYLDIGGYAVRICDTAGIKDLSTSAADLVEKEGIRRAISRAKTADIILHLIDGTRYGNVDDIKNLCQHYSDFMKDAGKVIHIINKRDLLGNVTNIDHVCRAISSDACVISCETSEGFDNLIEILTRSVHDLSGFGDTENSFITERHKSHLYKISYNIENSLNYCKSDLSISAHYLRQACEEISHITGEVSTENILEVIFKQFCIGK